MLMPGTSGLAAYMSFLGTLAPLASLAGAEILECGAPAVGSPVATLATIQAVPIRRPGREALHPLAFFS